MNSCDAIKIGLDMADFVWTAYVQDLTDSDLMRRPHEGCNHVNWQLGHIIVSEHDLMGKIAPNQMPALPAGFAAKYTKETASSNDSTRFATKEELLSTAKQQREGTLKILSGLSDADLEKPTGLDYASTYAALVSLLGSHYLMHAGQWVVVRRELGKPALF